MLSLSVLVHLLCVHAPVMLNYTQIMQPETLNPLKNTPNPTAETLTLRSKEEGRGLYLKGLLGHHRHHARRHGCH